jgi:hypothetical protein
MRNYFEIELFWFTCGGGITESELYERTSSCFDRISGGLERYSSEVAAKFSSLTKTDDSFGVTSLAPLNLLFSNRPFFTCPVGMINSP